MHVIGRCFAAGVVLLLSTGCESSAPTSAVGPSLPATPSSLFPPPTGPSRTFAFADQSAYEVRDYTRSSSFVLYDNGAFALRYPGFEYRGRWSEANGVIDFTWEGWSVAGSWRATGMLNAGTLTVQYNIIMAMSDFEDAVYALQR